MCDTLFCSYYTCLLLIKCLINLLHSSLSSTYKELVVLQVYQAYASFFYNSRVFTQVGFSKVAYIFQKIKLLLWVFKILIHPPILVFFPTIGFRAGPSKEAWSLEGRSIIMSNQERNGSIRPPIFDGRNFVYWKIRTTTYLQSLGTHV